MVEGNAIRGVGRGGPGTRRRAHHYDGLGSRGRGRRSAVQQGPRRHGGGTLRDGLPGAEGEPAPRSASGDPLHARGMRGEGGHDRVGRRALRRLFASVRPPHRAQEGCAGGREKISATQKAALAPQVPYVTLTLPKSAPSGTTVKWDSLVLNQPALGIPLPVNPGEHVATTQVPGGPAHEQRIAIQKAEKKQVELEIDLGVHPTETTAAAPRSTAPEP